ncbi:MAG: CorA family divalent cation transporter [Actinomycetes bacterium]
MDAWVVGQDGVRAVDAGDIGAAPRPDDGFVWVDVPEWSVDAERLLERLGCHPLVIEACRTRNHVPTVHAYERHLFVTLLAPLLGGGGHVHLLELDQLVAEGYLVTVHGPLNPAVDPAEALAETGAARRRIEQGRFRPGSPAALSYALGSAVARRQRALIGSVAEKLPGVEQEVMASEFREPEALLEQMFLIRHELVTARTTAAQSADVFARIAALDRHVGEELRRYAGDLADQFDRVRSIGDGEAQFLHGVIELYQTRVNTKMTVAMERLAVIAAVTLPVTAIASVVGMNVIVSEDTRWVALTLVLVLMLTISFLLLRWARRQGWW